MDEKKKRHVSFNLPPTEDDVLEAWMARHRVFSKSAAIRCMVRAGVARNVEPDDEPDLRKVKKARPA